MMLRRTSPSQASPRSRFVGGPPTPFSLSAPVGGGSLSSSLGSSAAGPAGAPALVTQHVAAQGSVRGPPLERTPPPADPLQASLRSMSANSGGGQSSLYARWRSAAAAGEADGRRVSNASVNTTETQLRTVPAVSSVPSTGSSCAWPLPTGPGTPVASPMSSVAAPAAFPSSATEGAPAVIVTRRQSRVIAAEAEGPAALRPGSAEPQQQLAAGRLSRGPSSSMSLARVQSLERTPTRLVATSSTVSTDLPSSVVQVQPQTRHGNDMLGASYPSSEASTLASIGTVPPTMAHRIPPGTTVVITSTDAAYGKDVLLGSIGSQRDPLGGSTGLQMRIASVGTAPATGLSTPAWSSPPATAPPTAPATALPSARSEMAAPQAVPQAVPVSQAVPSQASPQAAPAPLPLLAPPVSSAPMGVPPALMPPMIAFRAATGPLTSNTTSNMSLGAIHKQCGTASTPSSVSTDAFGVNNSFTDSAVISLSTAGSTSYPPSPKRTQTSDRTASLPSDPTLACSTPPMPPLSAEERCSFHWQWLSIQLLNRQCQKARASSSRKRVPSPFAGTAINTVGATTSAAETAATFPSEAHLRKAMEPSAGATAGATSAAETAAFGCASAPEACRWEPPAPDYCRKGEGRVEAITPTPTTEWLPVAQDTMLTWAPPLAQATSSSPSTSSPPKAPARTPPSPPTVAEISPPQSAASVLEVAQVAVQAVARACQSVSLSHTAPPAAVVTPATAPATTVATPVAAAPRTTGGSPAEPFARRPNRQEPAKGSPARPRLPATFSSSVARGSATSPSRQAAVATPVSGSSARGRPSCSPGRTSSTQKGGGSRATSPMCAKSPVVGSTQRGGTPLKGESRPRGRPREASTGRGGQSPASPSQPCAQPPPRGTPSPSAQEKVTLAAAAQEKVALAAATLSSAGSRSPMPPPPPPPPGSAGSADNHPLTTEAANALRNLSAQIGVMVKQKKNGAGEWSQDLLLGVAGALASAAGVASNGPSGNPAQANAGHMSTGSHGTACSSSGRQRQATRGNEAPSSNVSTGNKTVGTTAVRPSGAEWSGRSPTRRSNTPNRRQRRTDNNPACSVPRTAARPGNQVRP